MTDVALFARTADFAAKKHKNQRRKDKNAAPYINHPLGVAHLAASLGGISDIAILQAALLHDTIEDTDTTYDELVNEFGKTVADIVMEVTDDKSLPKDERKRAQIAHVPHISYEAKIVKLCDKLYNLRDLLSSPIPGYSAQRIQGYCVWSRMVLAGAAGINAGLDEALKREIFDASFELDGQTYACCPEGLDECHIFPKN